MADDNVKVVITVDGNTADAVRAMGKLQTALDDTGKKAEKTGLSITGMIKGAASGFATFNQAAEGVGKVFDFLGKSIDTAIDQQRQANLEKLLPTGSVDRFREATDKMISRQDVLRLSVKGLTGDFKINNEQMQTVLQTAVALSQKTGESADVIGDKLLDALAKGVNKLDDFGINLEKTGDRQADVNAAMSKFKDIIAENPVDEQTKSLMEMKDAINELTVALSGLIAEFAKGAAAAYRYSREGANYLGDIYDRFAEGSYVGKGYDVTSNAVERMTAKQKNREGIFGYTAGVNAIKGLKGTYAEGKKRDQSDYFQGLSEEDYATSLGFQTEGNLVDKYGTVGHKYEAKKDNYNYALGAELERRRNRIPGGRSYEGDLMGGAGAGDTIGTVNPLAVVIMGVGAKGRGLDMFSSAGLATLGDVVTRDQYAGLARKGSTGWRSQLGQAGTGFQAGSGESAALAGQGMGGYNPSDPVGSFSGAMHKKYGEIGGGAADAGMAGMLAGVEAMITGQQAVGKAIASASATALKAKAVEWGAFAVGELAWGLADLAFGSPTSAMHFASAAKFGAAAAAAGIGAAAIGSLAGGGGGGGGAHGAAGGGYASPTGARTGGPASSDTIVINMGDGFYGEAVAQGVRAGKRRGARDDYSATYSG
jgi:hypothetical protein